MVEKGRGPGVAQLQGHGGVRQVSVGALPGLAGLRAIAWLSGLRAIARLSGLSLRGSVAGLGAGLSAVVRLSGALGNGTVARLLARLSREGLVGVIALTGSGLERGLGLLLASGDDEGGNASTNHEDRKSVV